MINKIKIWVLKKLLNGDNTHINSFYHSHTNGIDTYKVLIFYKSEFVKEIYVH